MTPQSDPLDLWPDEISSGKVKPPIATLKEQAAALGRKTQNVVIGEVSHQADSHKSTSWAFLLQAPALGDYRFKLFEASYDPAELYPVNIRSEVPLPGRDNPFVKVENEEDLLVVLKEIFSSPKTIKAVQSIRSQSEGLA